MPTLRLDQVRRNGGTQARAEVSPDAVADYAEALRGGATFPAIVVFYDGTDYWLGDGFHRFDAHQGAGRTEIEAEVKQGTRRDAVLYSVGANAVHGLRRTNADKRRAVETLLMDAEWAQWSDREIARRAGVSQPFVGSLRPVASDNGYQMERTVQRGGTTYTQRTPAPRPAPAPQTAPERLAANMAQNDPAPAPAAAPAPYWPPHDPETGEVLTPAAPAEADYGLPELPREVREAGEGKTLPTETAHTLLHDALDMGGDSPRAQELHRLLNQLLTFERDGADLIATPFAATVGLHRAARAVAEMLGDWLPAEPAPRRFERVITVDPA